MDDGTVLLTFKIKNEENKVQEEIQKPQNPITITEEEMQKEVSKEIVLFGMMQHVTINGKKFDMNRIDFTQKVGEKEVWESYNKPEMMDGMIHQLQMNRTDTQ